MAAPVATPRVDPVGIHLDDGYRTLITIAADTDISFWEKSVQPPGIDGGDAIDTTTMHNDTWRTMAPRSLRTLTESNTTAAYDPSVFTQLEAVVNWETTITITHPDGSTWAYFGYVRSVKVSEHVDGEQPEMTIMIQPTNQDPAAGTEESPVVVSVAGT